MGSYFRIAIGSDHGGFKLKGELIRYLRNLGHEVKDCGCFSPESYDFPVSAADVAKSVSSKACDRGVMIDGAGFPSCIVANKFAGIRAAAVHDDFTAKISREHSDANIIGLGAMVVTPESAKRILELWLRTEFLGGKYQKRIDMITAADLNRSGAPSPKRVVTAEDIRQNPDTPLGPNVTLTPLARELLAQIKR